MTPVHVNLNATAKSTALGDSERIVASEDGNHFFTFRPDWKGPVPLPFRAAAATVKLSPTSEPPTVLILGFGMGAVGALMQRFRPGTKVVGVEPDETLHNAALQTLNDDTTLHLNDALGYLQDSTRTAPPTFDLIFDDCFIVAKDDVGQDQPYRPQELEAIPALTKAWLSKPGLYVRNLLDQDDLPIAEQRKRIQHEFHYTAERTYREWDNVLLVASGTEIANPLVAALGN